MRVDKVIAVIKAYTTRVGEGPFPTELLDADGERLRSVGAEFGTTTGRPRRCGWYDAVAVRYAVRINGLDALALTKLDVLDGIESIEVCTAYRCGGKTIHELPSDLAQLAACQPVYETVPGWEGSTKGVRRYADLPAGARRYIEVLEAASGVPAKVWDAALTSSERPLWCSE